MVCIRLCPIATLEKGVCTRGKGGVWQEATGTILKSDLKTGPIEFAGLKLFAWLTWAIVGIHFNANSQQLNGRSAVFERGDF